jgi:hypothetical protein
MKTGAKITTLAVAAVLVVAGVIAWPLLSNSSAGVIRFEAPEENRPFSYDDYAVALKAYVDDGGMVNYKGLKADPARLDAFGAALAALDPKTFEAWSDAEKIAFWANAYNALTLKAISHHYPIKASFGKSLLYPKNSIRQIPGVWTKLRFVVMGREMTLDEIEHKELRAKFDEPRIHMALVCAAMSCPPLRNEPYVAERLDEQFADQARRFLARKDRFRIDREKRTVHLSAIFKWFGGDFVKKYGTADAFEGHSDADRAVLNYTAGILPEDDARFLRSAKLSISYLDYDWTLNEQK